MTDSQSGLHGFARLYSQPIPSRRGGAVYRAFSYPTKIDAEAIALFIATHTAPGDRVLDVFAGSGATGIAAKLCDSPTARMHELADELGLEPEWGPRRATLYELSPLGALLGRVMCDPPPPVEFRRAAQEVVTIAEQAFGWAYEAKGPEGELGHIRHVIWSDVIRFPCCDFEGSLWDAAVQLKPAEILDAFPCPACSREVQMEQVERVLAEKLDPLTGLRNKGRVRLPARVYGRSGKTTWSREPIDEDLGLIEKVASTPVENIPTGKIYRGDLYRSGYHRGIERFHHLYTDRNLRAVASLWSAIETQPEQLRDALRLLVLSYNASHSTLMSRVVVKRNQPDFVLTGAQTGVLYISGLPVEKNVLAGVRRKINTFAGAFSMTSSSRSEVEVVCGSSTRLKLPDQCVDYVFTDPPFGDYIPYAEINQVNEAWLGDLTDHAEEVIVSPTQNKGVREYGNLLSQVFGEVARVLKPEGLASVVFHASKPEVWEAIGQAFRSNGLMVQRTSLLDKEQESFKQVVSEGSTRGDAIFLLQHGESRLHSVDCEEPSESIDEELVAASIDTADREGEGLSRQHSYSRYVALCLEKGAAVALSAPEFYKRFSAVKGQGSGSTG